MTRQHKQMLKDMDDQTLMSLAAHALERIASGPGRSRRMPI